jgi:hypothetical protein
MAADPSGTPMAAWQTFFSKMEVGILVTSITNLAVNSLLWCLVAWKMSFTMCHPSTKFRSLQVYNVSSKNYLSIIINSIFTDLRTKKYSQSQLN